ncbi:MAG: hypothetical protein JSS35_09130, partial [Proteobacteria bacterium]|nr:hypothetical protein [Pseudomonadota bacterium]
MISVRPILVAASVLALASAGSLRAQPVWTPTDRAAARTVLGPPAETLDASQLDAALVAYAETELGQRIRPGDVDRSWAIAPPRRDVPAELAAARRDDRL